MNINYKKWKELDVDFNQKLIEYDKLLEYWDQDLLNHILLVFVSLLEFILSIIMINGL